jgi:hypothetical protein
MSLTQINLHHVVTAAFLAVVALCLVQVVEVDDQPAATPQAASPAPVAVAVVYAVLGATGLQGGACVAELRRLCPLCSMRALTRNASSPEAQWLQQTYGVMLVEGQLESEAALQQLLRGADGVFAVTFSDFAAGTELANGRRLAETALAEGVGRLVFSSGVRTALPMLNVKADLEDLLRTIPLKHQVFLQSSFFFENLVVKGGRPRVQCEWSSDTALLPSSMTFSSPFPADFAVVMHSARDIGRIAAQILLQSTSSSSSSSTSSSASPNGELARFESGTAVRVIGGKVSGEQYAKAFADELRRRRGVSGSQVDVKFQTFPLQLLRRMVRSRDCVCCDFNV